MIKATSTKFELEACGDSHCGQVRPSNQDRFFLGPIDDGGSVLSNLADRIHDEFHGTDPNVPTLMVVADGMGGHAAGELSAELAVRGFVGGITNRFATDKSVFGDVDKAQHLMREVIHECQKEQLAVQAADAMFQGMGTTLTGVVIDGPQIHVVHVGDSRCYLWRQGTLQRLTRDHTLAQLYFEEGIISEDEVKNSEWSHRVYKALGGTEKRVLPDISSHRVFPNDKLVVCSDGLMRHVDDSEIAAILGRSRAKEACGSLMQLCLDRGGRDNISILTAELLY